jgi:hypothetical protein
MWKMLKYVRHQAIYYNTSYRRLMWLNGRGLDQMEFLVPMVSTVPLGIEATGHAVTIQLKLFAIREARIIFPY